MKQSEYFKQRVLSQRPYIRLEWCIQTVRNPEFSEKQPDGRMRYWRYIEELDKFLRMIILEDGETLHNAFPDGVLNRAIKCDSNTFRILIHSI